jgi:hypothetical protein
VSRYQLSHPDESARVQNEIARALLTLLDRLPQGATTANKLPQPRKAPNGKPRSPARIQPVRTRAEPPASNPPAPPGSDITALLLCHRIGGAPGEASTLWRISLQPLSLSDQQRRRVLDRCWVVQQLTSHDLPESLPHQPGESDYVVTLLMEPSSQVS